MVDLILTCVACVIFVVYNIVAIFLFGVPKSLSDTYYYYNEKKKHLGIVFTLMMFTIALTMMPAWLSITENITPWSHNLTILPFLAAGCIAFVGAAPNFKGIKMENRVHMISAKAAAVFSILWIAVVCYKIAWIIPLWLVLIWAVAYITKTHKSARDYWWEMVAFGATFSSIIIESALLL